MKIKNITLQYMHNTIFKSVFKIKKSLKPIQKKNNFTIHHSFKTKEYLFFVSYYIFMIL